MELDNGIGVRIDVKSIIDSLKNDYSNSGNTSSSTDKGIIARRLLSPSSNYVLTISPHIKSLVFRLHNKDKMHIICYIDGVENPIKITVDTAALPYILKNIPLDVYGLRFVQRPLSKSVFNKEKVENISYTTIGYSYLITFSKRMINIDNLILNLECNDKQIVNTKVVNTKVVNTNASSSSIDTINRDTVNTDRQPNRSGHHIYNWDACLTLPFHFHWAYEFISTRIGFCLAVGTISLGFTAFVMLTYSGSPAAATTALCCAVFGGLCLASIAGAVSEYKRFGNARYSLFKDNNSRDDFNNVGGPRSMNNPSSTVFM